MSSSIKHKKRMSIGAILSVLILISGIAYGSYNLIISQTSFARSSNPADPPDSNLVWDKTINWTGGNAGIYENLSYNDLPMNQNFSLDDFMDSLNQTVFTVTPPDPPQYWRKESYDQYTGSNWKKTSTSTNSLNLISSADVPSGSVIYTVRINVTADAPYGNITLPTISPHIMIIQDSLRTNPPNAISSYSFETDIYGSAILSMSFNTHGLIELSYNITYAPADLTYISGHALAPTYTPSSISDYFAALPDDLPNRVRENATNSGLEGSNAYETAVNVMTYLQSRFKLILSGERPPEGTDTVEWFLDRGGGLDLDFATAHVVFLRCLGVSARVVFGYGAGETVGNERVIKIMHVHAWSEVYIPTSTDGSGEWVQFEPTPINEIPYLSDWDLPEEGLEGNLNATLTLSTSTLIVRRYEQFNITAQLKIGLSPISGQNVVFWDYNSSRVLGSDFTDSNGIAQISTHLTTSEPLGLQILIANITTEQGTLFNYTFVLLQGGTNLTDRAGVIWDASLPPLDESSYEPPASFIPASIVPIDLRLGEEGVPVYRGVDTLKIFGVLQDSDGNNISSSTTTNDEIEIYYDGELLGTTTFDENGYYEYIYNVPANETLGNHTIYSYYAGDYYTLPNGTQIPVIMPSTSKTTIITVKGSNTITIQSSSDLVYIGNNVTFSGALYFDNGSVMVNYPVSIWVNNGSWYKIAEVYTNSTGNYTYTYHIPIGYPVGTIYVYSQFNSTDPTLNNATSRTISVLITKHNTTFTITAPTRVIIGQNLTIDGFLHLDTGEPLSGIVLSLYWNNGTEYLIGSVTTNSTGGYYFNYTVPYNHSFGYVYVYAMYSGNGTIFSNHTTPFRVLVDYIHVNLSLETFSDVGTDRVIIGRNITISGILTYENGTPITNAKILIYWNNGTSFYTNGTEYLLAAVYTNSTGGYYFNYTVPYYHSFVDVQIYTTYTSAIREIGNGTSPTNIVSVDYIHVNLSIFVVSDWINPTKAIVNHNVTISGILEYENGTAISNAYVAIYWNNGTEYRIANITTNSTGGYEFDYTVPYNHSYGLVSIFSYYISHIRHIGNGTSDAKSLEVSYIDVTINQYVHLAWGYTDTAIINTTLSISGTISLENGTILDNVNVEIFWNNGTEYSLGTVVTNSTGGFSLDYTVPYHHDLTGVQIYTKYYSQTREIGNCTSSLSSINVDNLHTQITITVNTLISSNIAPITSTVDISGVATYTNHTTTYYYENGLIQIYWNNGSEYLIAEVHTNSTGGYSFSYRVPYEHDFSNVQIYAKFVSYDLLYTNSSSSLSSITIRNYLTDITIDSTKSIAYPGDTVAFYGRLTLSINGTPLSNKQIFIYTQAESTLYLLGNGYTNATGYFNISIIIPSDVIRGPYNIWSNFTSIDRLYNNSYSSYFSLTIRKIATLTITIKERVTIGSTFYIAGQVLDANNNPEANVLVELSIDSLSWSDSATTNAEGKFNISLVIPDTASVGAYTVKGHVPASTYLDVTDATASFNIYGTVNLSATIGNPNYSYYVQDTVPITGVLLDNSDNPLASRTIRVFIGSHQITSVLTNSTGGFAISLLLNSVSSDGQYEIIVSFPGDSSYISANVTETLHIFVNARLTITNIPTGDFSPGDTITVSGTLVDSNDDPIKMRQVNYYVANHLIGSVNTDNTGKFSVSYQVPTNYTESTLTIVFRSVANSQDEVTFNIVLNNNNNTNTTPGGASILQISELLPIIGLGFFIVVIILYYFMVYKHSKPSEVVLDIPAKLRNIKRLADSGQYSEAIALAYQTFELMAERTIGVKRASYQTAREYIDQVLKDLPIPKDLVMSFLNYYEEARFSNHTITKEQYDNAIRLFTEIYPRLTGGTE